jgi:hypothetical protein
MATLVVPASFADWVTGLEHRVREVVVGDKSAFFASHEGISDVDVRLSFRSMLSPDGVSLCVSLPPDWQLVGGDGTVLDRDAYRPAGELGVATLRLRRVCFGCSSTWGFMFELSCLRLVGQPGTVSVKRPGVHAAGTDVDISAF